MYIDIVNKEIHHAVNRNAYPYKKQREKIGENAAHNVTSGTGEGKNKKEPIVFMKKTID
jgi:hypothetical protein